jgi:hypothetical protein
MLVQHPIRKLDLTTDIPSTETILPRIADLSIGNHRPESYRSDLLC